MERPLSLAIMRVLGDRLYEKRKTAALEVEHLVRSASRAGDTARVAAVLTQLGSTDFACSTQSNFRKGGLIGLAASAIGLSDKAGAHLSEILPPILRCLVDQDSRVRYYACEAFYNMAKVVRGQLMPYFNEVFDVLCKLIADSDPNVKGGAQHVDRLMKDVVTEYESFDMGRFVPLLSSRINVRDPYVRQFVVGWVTVLDSVPQIDMILYLSRFLAGLFEMLSDSHNEVRNQADAALSDFLRGMENPESHVAFGSVANIAVRYASSGDDFTRAIAVRWLGAIVDLGGTSLPSRLINDILSAILPCRSHELEEIRKGALRVSNSLLDLVKHEGSDAGEPVSSSKEEDPSSKDDKDKDEKGNEEKKNEGKGGGDDDSAPKDKKIEGKSGDANDNTDSNASNNNAHDDDKKKNDDNTVRSVGMPIDVGAILRTILRNLASQRRPTRKMALHWVSSLLRHFPKGVARENDILFPVLLSSLRDRADDIAVLALDILCRVCHGSTSGCGGSSAASEGGTGKCSDTFRSDFFRTFLGGLVSLCRNDSAFLEHRLPLIIRKAAMSVSPVKIYATLSKIIIAGTKFSKSSKRTSSSMSSSTPSGLSPSSKMPSSSLSFSSQSSSSSSSSKGGEMGGDIEFAATLVQRLNLILLTCEELSGLRDALIGAARGLPAVCGTSPAALEADVSSTSSSKKKKGGAASGSDSSLATAEGGASPVQVSLFVTLYRAWSHSPGTAFSLCILAEAYPLASDLVRSFAHLEVSIDFLVDMDRLVRLLESPVFVRARLHLLDPSRYPELVRALYGVLMCLPQGAAYHALKNRLAAVSNLQTLPPAMTTSVKHSSPGSSVPACDLNDIGFDKEFDTTNADGLSLLRHFLETQGRHADLRRHKAAVPTPDPDDDFAALESAEQGVDGCLGEIPSLSTVHTKTPIITMP